MPNILIEILINTTFNLHLTKENKSSINLLQCMMKKQRCREMIVRNVLRELKMADDSESQGLDKGRQQLDRRIKICCRTNLKYKTSYVFNLKYKKKSGRMYQFMLNREKLD